MQTKKDFQVKFHNFQQSFILNNIIVYVRIEDLYKAIALKM